MSPFIRRVKTSSGATAVQIVDKRRGVRTILKHVGSAHSEAELALLMVVAQQELHEGQDTLDLDLEPVAVARSQARVLSSASEILWNVLVDAYRELGFDTLGDDAFRALVLARLVEPTSKADTVRVLGEIGAPVPHVNTLHAALRRASERGYRDKIACACMAYSLTATGPAMFVMYDVTTLHFENDDEDILRRVGMSKEHRVDPQVQVGLLVDHAGVPLEMHLFEGNKAETTTLIPVLRAFQERHGIDDIVVVADAGMLSAGNLNALEDARLGFIVGSRLTKAPYDLDEHFTAHGNYFEDGQILESARVMGTGAGARERRIVYQWSFTRNKRDDRNINLMIAKAERIAAGQAPMRKARFLKVSGARKELDQATIDRAPDLAHGSVVGGGASRVPGVMVGA